MSDGRVMDLPARPGATIPDCLPDRDASRLLTVQQAAAQLNVPVSWLRGRVANRAVACTRLGRHVRFTQAQLAAIVAAAEQPRTDDPPAGLTRRSRRGRTSG